MPFLPHRGSTLPSLLLCIIFGFQLPACAPQAPLAAATSCHTPACRQPPASPLCFRFLPKQTPLPPVGEP
eukprot:CAMPEP_0173393196 /NCGR_PEP_ID=MMETSP1356-20130122/21973_1 /TAXON_ID=77927 ORGANISM="Hemiselmis virescens, Strain PCC157" /NCGR_SAMPLE_ID=MMETSP1356 /ASSEMBLY_ACC=CAM_ASM_000847 /LENGTH=69 /DNA_ID=CAMNT_0014351179 /DNA_START=275 /DNA_END=480 /DNA_ORIENTATION=-